jgi:hypothetical protein
VPDSNGNLHCGAACTGDGSACSNNEDCCSGAQCIFQPGQTFGTCGGSASCSQAGQACSDTQMCCSGQGACDVAGSNPVMACPPGGSDCICFDVIQ